MTVAVISSPRARRRAFWLTGLGVAAAAIAGAVVLMPSHSSGGSTAHTAAPAAAAKAATAAKAAPAPASSSPDYQAPRTVPAPRAAITTLLDAFIPSVIARKNLAQGWDLVTSDARGSKAEWLTGVTPFQAFAARSDHFDGWTLNYSYPGDVGFDVFVSPKDPHSISMAFRGEAKKVGGKWKIAVFYPQATFQPAGKKQYVWADTDLQPQAVSAAGTEGRLSAAWLLLPFGLAGAALVGGIAFAVVRWSRSRSRVKEIERELALLR